jgi:hypothetical protein
MRKVVFWLVLAVAMLSVPTVVLSANTPPTRRHKPPVTATKATPATPATAATPATPAKHVVRATAKAHRVVRHRATAKSAARLKTQRAARARNLEIRKLRNEITRLRKENSALRMRLNRRAAKRTVAAPKVRPAPKMSPAPQTTPSPKPMPVPRRHHTAPGSTPAPK